MEENPSTPAPNPPAGFYKDPTGLQMERWWDGSRWTERTRPSATGTSQAASLASVRRWDWKRIANFSARARRSEFWAAWALALFATLVGAFIDASLGPEAGSFTLVSILVWIWLFWGASVNRAHDLGQSGWISLLLLIPLVNLGVILWLGIQEGMSETNQWGPPVS